MIVITVCTKVTIVLLNTSANSSRGSGDLR